MVVFYQNNKYPQTLGLQAYFTIPGLNLNCNELKQVHIWKKTEKEKNGCLVANSNFHGITMIKQNRIKASTKI